jgi:2-polyprenyl-3-methyl-5-hydroxy-6-metoxy-1,4-benzoquinol methylase
MSVDASPKNVRVLSALDQGHDGFRIDEDRAMRALWRAEREHFWHRSRNHYIAARLAKLGVHPPASIIELGCGSGCVTAYLARLGYTVTGIDGHPRLVFQAATRAPRATFVVHDLSEGLDLLGDEPPADVVALFDVIEHLDGPASVLEGALSLVKPGGLLVGTVPALMALWSDVDVQAGHRTRYSAKTLRALLASVRGAAIRELAPFNRALVPMLWAQRKLVVGADTASTSENNLRVPPPPLNAALYSLLRAEHRASALLDLLPLPGASLWFALRKE